MNKTTLRLQFLDLDRDKSGFITAEELLAVMPHGTIEKAQEIVKTMDTNNDGQISYEEFLWFYEGMIETDPQEALEYVDKDVNFEQALDAQEQDFISEDDFDSFEDT